MRLKHPWISDNDEADQESGWLETMNHHVQPSPSPLEYMRQVSRDGQHGDVVGVAGKHIACENHEWQRQDRSIIGQVKKGQK